MDGRFNSHDPKNHQLNLRHQSLLVMIPCIPILDNQHLKILHMCQGTSLLLDALQQLEKPLKKDSILKRTMLHQGKDPILGSTKLYRGPSLADMVS